MIINVENPISKAHLCQFTWNKCADLKCPYLPIGIANMKQFENQQLNKENSIILPSKMDLQQYSF
jgi:hypothetical protein